MKLLKPPYKSKFNKILAIITVVGLIIITVGPLVYYKFHLGIKPCSSTSAEKISDASNCGDADFGALYFWFIGGPMFFFAGSILAASLLLTRFDKNYFRGSSMRRFIKVLAVTIIMISIMLFLTSLYAQYDVGTHLNEPIDEPPYLQDETEGL